MASACESPISSPICFRLSPAALPNILSATYFPVYRQPHTAQYTVSYKLPPILSATYFPVYLQLHTAQYTVSYILPSISSATYFPVYLQLHTAQYTFGYILPSIPSATYCPVYCLKKKKWAPGSSNKQNHSLWEYTVTQVGLASSVCSWISSSTKLGCTTETTPEVGIRNHVHF
jgi:hypothetical protein